MNRDLFAKYQFNAKCTTNTLGQIRSRYKSVESDHYGTCRTSCEAQYYGGKRDVYISFPESNIDIGPIYIDWYRYS